MSGDNLATVLVSVALLAANALLVAAEYGLVGSRPTRIEALARKGNKKAARLLQILQDVSAYVATIQVGITLCGIAIGAVTEPALTNLIEPVLRFLPESVVRVLSIVTVALPLVVAGELVPKYTTIRNPERVALATLGVLTVMSLVLKPLSWLTQKSAELAARAFGVDIGQPGNASFSREEFALLVQASHAGGHFEEAQATVLNRALRLDKLDAADVMIHRLDIRWLDKSVGREGLANALGLAAHSRMPVCDGDIDEVVGVAYLQDIVRAWDEPGFQLEQVIRPAVFVPQNLTLDKVVQRMREAKSQILLVLDEYGGTAGLLTLEDVVEEVFGELEDSLEGERPPLERVSAHRVTARADVRYDELLDFLNIEPGDDDDFTTETLAEIMVNELGRVPKLGDAVELAVGRLLVENMARRRVTRLVILERARAEKPSP